MQESKLSMSNKQFNGWKLASVACLFATSAAAMAQATAPGAGAAAATASAAAAPAASAPVLAHDAVLVEGHGVKVTVEDARSDALRLPPQVRGPALADPQRIQQLATNLYVRRVLAAQAEAAGLAKKPEVHSALQIAHDRVLSDAWLERINAEAKPAPAALEGQARNYYNANPDKFMSPEEIHARHILIMGSDDAAHAKAQQLLDQIKQGGDFAELAKANSMDRGSAAKGGDLGFFAKGKMVPEFEEAAFALKKDGDLADLVQSKFGWHIIQRQGFKPSAKLPYDQVREQLQLEVVQQAQASARTAAGAKIEQQATGNQSNVDALAKEFERQATAAGLPVVPSTSRPTK